MKSKELKQYLFFDKSIQLYFCFQFLFIIVYILSDFLIENILMSVFFILFYFIGRNKIRKNINVYFRFVYLSYLFMVFYTFFALYLILGSGFFIVTFIIFLVWVFDFYLFNSGIGRVVIFNQDKFLNYFDNIDKSCFDFEIENKLPWMVSQWYFTVVLLIYMLVIGPYFFIFNYDYYFIDYANLNGYGIGTVAYAIIGLLIVYWQMVLKRTLFFSKILDLKIEINK